MLSLVIEGIGVPKRQAIMINSDRIGSVARDECSLLRGITPQDTLVNHFALLVYCREDEYILA